MIDSDSDFSYLPHSGSLFIQDKFGQIFKATIGSRAYTVYRMSSLYDVNSCDETVERLWDNLKTALGSCKYVLSPVTKDALFQMDRIKDFIVISQFP